MRKNLKRFASRMDSSSVGGAMVLGVSKPLVKAHGNSNPYAFCCAIRQVREMVVNDIINHVVDALPKKEVEKND